MKTTVLSEHPEAKSPAGADIRFLMDGKTGNMIHSAVPAQLNALIILLFPGIYMMVMIMMECLHGSAIRNQTFNYSFAPR